MRIFFSEQPYEAEHRDRQARAEQRNKKNRFAAEKEGLVVQPLPPPLFLPCVMLDALETSIIRHDLAHAAEIRDQVEELVREKKLTMAWVYPAEPTSEKDTLWSVHLSQPKPKRRNRYNPEEF